VAREFLNVFNLFQVRGPDGQGVIKVRLRCKVEVRSWCVVKASAEKAKNLMKGWAGPGNEGYNYFKKESYGEVRCWM